jgi:hypothetical protein
MSRFGWFLFALGLMIAAASVVWFAWITAFDPATSELGMGFLFAAGFWGSVIVADIGAAAVAKARGMHAGSWRG